jgi:hypothetical protein
MTFTAMLACTQRLTPWFLVTIAPVLLFLLAGCSSPYKAPVGGPTATIEVAGKDGLMVSTLTEDGRCERVQHFQPSGERFGNFVSVPAGRPIWLAQTASTTFRSCKVALTVTPVAGARYSIAIGMSESASFCTVSLQRNDQGAPVPEPSAKQVDWVPGCM